VTFRSRLGLLALGLLALGLLALATSACRVPVFFPEFQVDTDTPDYSFSDDAAIANDGGFIVTWGDYETEPDIYGRAFSPLTSPLGDSFPVNANTVPARREGSIARDASGRYVIVWSEDGTSIWGQRWSSDGTPLGGNFQVNTSTPLESTTPLVASDPSGNFVVAWTAKTAGAAGVEAVARRFGSNGAPLGGELAVNAYTTGPQSPSGIAMSASGFVVTWGGNYGPGSSGAFGRVFDASGGPITEDFAVNSIPLSYDTIRPDVAMNAAGGFVVVWSDESGVKWCRGRRFAADGEPLGDEFPVRDVTTALNASNPRVASDSAGNFLVAWEEESFSDLGDFDVFGRFYDMSGETASDPFLINEVTADRQFRARPSLADDGSWVVAFTSGGSGQYHVKGRKNGVRAAPAIAMDPNEPISSPAGGSGLGNGVFEPGETQVLRTAWINDSAEQVESIIGQTELFTGPAGATYTINDAEAIYDVLPTGQAKSCAEEGDCYSVTVSDPIPRPLQHWDALLQEQTNMSLPHTWVLHLGESFSDVPLGNQFYRFIETLFHKGVTGGCAGGGYCATNPVTRAQMAVFLLKSKFGSAHIPPPCTGSVFPDVPCTGGPFDPWIEELAGLGITGGCGGGNYCPNNTVTRQQMAVFLLKAFEGSAYVPPTCAGVFDDVPCTPGTGFSDWIEELADRGITGGCSVTPLLYCPTNPNNRGQMAVFLTKTFGLVLYGG